MELERQLLDAGDFGDAFADRGLADRQ